MSHASKIIAQLRQGELETEDDELRARLQKRRKELEGARADA